MKSMFILHSERSTELWKITSYRGSITSRWDFLTDEMRKPLWPLLSIVLTAFVFYAGKIDDWLVAGIVVGLAAGGGYSLFSGITKAGVKPPPIMPVILLLCGLLLVSGCTDKMISPAEQLLAALLAKL